MANRVKKMVWVEEDQLKYGVPQSTTGSGRLTTAEMINKQIPVPVTRTEQLQKQIMLFNADVEETLKKPLPPKLKLLEYLRKMNKLLNYREDLEEEQRKSILALRGDVPRVVEKPEMKPETKPEMMSIETVAPSPVGRQDVRVDPGSVLKYGKEQQSYSKDNIQKSLHNRIKPRFNKVLDELETKSGFRWNQETGEVTINNKIYSGTDIRDLILHRVRMDMKESTGDPPPQFKKFNQFLVKRNVTSKSALRNKGPAVSVRELSGKVLKRDKSHTLKVAGSGARFLNY
jgi:hypothetical protein